MVPHLKEPPPGSFSLFFWAAATCVETVAIALFPGNTVGFTTGTARRQTTFVHQISEFRFTCQSWVVMAGAWHKDSVSTSISPT